MQMYTFKLMVLSSHGTIGNILEYYNYQVLTLHNLIQEYNCMYGDIFDTRYFNNIFRFVTHEKTHDILYLTVVISHCIEHAINQ